MSRHIKTNEQQKSLTTRAVHLNKNHLIFININIIIIVIIILSRESPPCHFQIWSSAKMPVCLKGEEGGEEKTGRRQTS